MQNSDITKKIVHPNQPSNEISDIEDSINSSIVEILMFNML